MTLLALIPARGGSKGVPRKNIRLFNGKPLIQWTIDIALASPYIGKVVVSTDDAEIRDIAVLGGAEAPFLRPRELADDHSPGIDTVLHALGELPEVTEVMLLQPTSPLKQLKDLENVIKLRKAHPYDCSVVSLTESAKHPAWMYNLSPKNLMEPILETNGATCRQQMPTAYTLNGAFYLASRKVLEQSRSFIQSDTVGYVMPALRSVDIDTQLDWDWAEFLMKKQLQEPT